MTVLNEGRYVGDWLKAEQGHQLSRNTGTMLAGEGILEIGTVLGLITASGKWKRATATGSDGAQIARAILCQRVDTGESPGADVLNVVIVDRGPARVNLNALVWGPTIDTQAERDAALAQLESNAFIKANRGA